MGKKCTDGQIITALLAAQTLTEAAELLGVSRRTLYNYLADPELDEKLKEARKMQDEQLAHLRETATAEAIQCLVNILRDKPTNWFSDVTTGDQIEAAKALLTYGNPKKRNP